MTVITDPTALADQLSAAVREAHNATKAMRSQGAHVAYLTAPTPWLASQLTALFAAIDDGTARGCQHLESGPRVVFAAAWTPATLVCAHCAPALTPADEAEETTCDKCRTRGPLIHPRSITAGPLVYAYGLCDDCAQTEPDGHAKPRTKRPRAQR